MSGPITVVFSANPVLTLLSASAIRAGVAVYEGYAQAAALQQEHAQRGEQSRAQHEAARQLAQAAQGDAAQVALQELDQLQTLAERLGIAEQVRAARPAPPASTRPEAQAAYLNALQTLAAELRPILLTEAARQLDQLGDEVADIALPAAVPRTLGQRLLARIAHLGPAPQHLASVALELDQCLPGARAELLATELRARVQAYVATQQQEQVQQATATIVEQSLKDLGYQVEEIGSTLFVEGGMVHFRRPGWGAHMVRMRVDAKAATLNFNVVRAVTAGHNERSVLDHLAEDRWCSEFPALLKTLQARGVKLNVTRRLAAGELPVQLVDASKLPTFTDEEAHTPAAAQGLQRKKP
jgi:hypothetical protein